MDRNNWGCAPSRAVREGACRTAGRPTHRLLRAECAFPTRAPPRSTSLYRPGSQPLLPCTLQTRGLRPLPALAFLPKPGNREQQRIRAIVPEKVLEFVGPNQAFLVVVLSHRDSFFDTHGGIDLLRRRGRSHCIFPSFRF